MIYHILVNTGNRNSKLKTGSTGLSVVILPVLINSLATTDKKLSFYYPKRPPPATEFSTAPDAFSTLSL